MALHKHTLAALAVAVLVVIVAFQEASAQTDHGFVVRQPDIKQGRASGLSMTNDWTNPVWRGIRANMSAQLDDIDNSFNNFQSNNRRNGYRNATARAQAKAAFQKNLEFIVAENAKGTNPFVLGVTNFTDLTFDEFKAQFLMTEQTKTTTTASGIPSNAAHSVTKRGLLQTNTSVGSCGIHWGEPSYNPLGRSVISSIKNQGGCGSCWAFAGAAQLESYIAMQNSTKDNANFLDVSEQMLIDCSYAAGYDSCAGGWPTAAWDWIKSNKGVPPEAVRPYTSGATGTYTGNCNSGTAPRALGSPSFNSYTWISPQTDAALAAALQTQPVFTAVAAGPEFQNYVGGAITCATTGLTHAVQTVGCGYIPSADGATYLPVYAIKNSWGSWGYGGFGYMLRTTEAGGGCQAAAGAYTLS